MKKLILLVLFLALIGLVNQASAFTATINTPATNEDSVSGTSYVLNATVPAGSNVLNCTFYAKSASTANTTYGLLNASITNTSSAQTEFTTNWDTTSVEDSNDYSFNLTCYNATDNGVDTNTGIEIDNGVPTIASVPSPTDKSTDTDGSVAFSVTVTGSETTGCTLYFSGINPGSSSYAMTHSGNTCTKSAITFPEQTYYWYVIATDGTNTTTGTTYRVGVDISHSTPKAAYIQSLVDQGVIDSSGGPEFTIAKPGKALSIAGTSNIFGMNMKTILGIPNFIWVLIIIGGIVIYVKKK